MKMKNETNIKIPFRNEEAERQSYKINLVLKR